MSLNILVVCDGNLCRSPLAERLLASRLAAAGATDVQVSSAGVRGVEGAPMDSTAAAELERLGGSADGFRARRITTELVDDKDLVLVATRDLRTKVLQESPRAMRRTFTLLELAALADRWAGDSTATPLLEWAAANRSLAEGELDLPDPINASPATHRAVADRIDDAITRLVVAFPA